MESGDLDSHPSFMNFLKRLFDSSLLSIICHKDAVNCIPELSPLTEPSPAPAWCGPRGPWAAVCGAKVRSVPRPCRAPWRRQPRSPNQCRWPWGTGLEVQGVDPFSPSLFLSLLPLRAQLPGKIIQATPLKRPHGRASN